MEEGFLPIIQYRGGSGASYPHPKEPEFQVDFLTPRVADNDDPIQVEHIDVPMQPLRFMEFSLEDVQQATLFDPTGRCVVVSLPAPQRYAVHKLLIIGERAGAYRSKVSKDLAQAASLSNTLQRSIRKPSASPGPTPSPAVPDGANARSKGKRPCPRRRRNWRLYCRAKKLQTIRSDPTSHHRLDADHVLPRERGLRREVRRHRAVGRRDAGRACGDEPARARSDLDSVAVSADPCGHADIAQCVHQAPRFRAQTISIARKSLTFVNVGPGTSRSPSGLKKL